MHSNDVFASAVGAAKMLFTVYASIAHWPPSYLLRIGIIIIIGIIIVEVVERHEIVELRRSWFDDDFTRRHGDIAAYLGQRRSPLRTGIH